MHVCIKPSGNKLFQFQVEPHVSAVRRLWFNCLQSIIMKNFMFGNEFSEDGNFFSDFFIYTISLSPKKNWIFRNKFARFKVKTFLKKNLGKFITKNPNFFVEITGQTIRKFYFLGIFNIVSNTINMTQKWCASQ
jgi:hypothetical protein